MLLIIFIFLIIVSLFLIIIIIFILLPLFFFLFLSFFFFSINYYANQTQLQKECQMLHVYKVMTNFQQQSLDG